MTKVFKHAQRKAPVSIKLQRHWPKEASELVDAKNVLNGALFFDGQVSFADPSSSTSAVEADDRARERVS